MFGRAGSRGLDATGYVLFCPDVPRLRDAHARQLKRAAQVDWPSFISVMRGAAERAEKPFEAAVRLSHCLFSPQPVAIGAEIRSKPGRVPAGCWWMTNVRDSLGDQPLRFSIRRKNGKVRVQLVDIR